MSVQITKHGEVHVQHQMKTSRSSARAWRSARGDALVDVQHGKSHLGSDGEEDKGNLGSWCGWWVEFFKTVECKAPARELACPDEESRCCIPEVPLRIPTSSQRKRGSPLFKDSRTGLCDRLIGSELSWILQEISYHEAAAKNSSAKRGASVDSSWMLVDCTSGFPKADKDGSRDAELLRVYERFRPWNDDPSTCCSGRVGPVRFEWFLHHRFIADASRLYCAPKLEATSR